SAVLEGVLLEEMVTGTVELFIGARVDREFGPVVLFGLGGSNVEGGIPPAAALAPLDENQTDRLVNQMRAGARPETLSSVAERELKRYLIAVGGPDGMIFRDGVSELDINPIIVDGDRCVAVDAVVHQASELVDSVFRNEDALETALVKRRSRLGGLSALF